MNVKRIEILVGGFVLGCGVGEPYRPVHGRSGRPWRGTRRLRGSRMPYKTVQRRLIQRRESEEVMGKILMRVLARILIGFATMGAAEGAQGPGGAAERVGRISSTMIDSARSDNGVAANDPVSGLWLVQSYRSQFAQVLTKPGVDGLVTALTHCNASAQKK